MADAASQDRCEDRVHQSQRIPAVGLLDRDAAVAIGECEHAPAAVGQPRGVRRDRHRAAAGEGAGHGAFSMQGERRIGMVGTGHEGLLTRADLKHDDPLAGFGRHLAGLDAKADLVGESETVEAGGSQDDGIEPAFRAFPEARFDVAADGLDLQVGPDAQELRDTPDRRR